MLAILNSLNVHNFPIFQPILMILVSKFMVHRALSVKTYLSLGLLSPLNFISLEQCFGHRKLHAVITSCKQFTRTNISSFFRLNVLEHLLYHII